MHEKIQFAHGKRTYTARLENLVVDLLDIATIKSVAEYLHLTWDTVKDIHKRRLKSRYGNPNIRIATDLSKAFIATVMEHAPLAVHVFDHFHVVKLMNDAIDKLRSRMYHEEKDLNRRKVIKGMRWLLLCNGKDIYDDKHKERLENALAMN